MNTPTTTDGSPEALRARMVDRVREAGRARLRSVEQALGTVPRHAFLPETTACDAYADATVVTKRDHDGAALSCASEPAIVAMMLDRLDVRPGDRVLEIGAGTGYNAALLAWLTGPSGRVTTIDLDSEVTTGARRALEAAGYGGVTVLTRDGGVGDPDGAPYDRIIVTVGAWDLPPAWREQLAPGGRLVVPLRWRGQSRSVAFTRDDGLLRSEAVDLCGFIPMIGQQGEYTDPIDPDGHVALYRDADQPINPAALTGVLTQPATTTWSGAMVGLYDPFDGVWLNLTAAEPGTCRIAADQTAVDSGLCTPAIPMRSPALVDGVSLAYLTTGRLPDSPDRRSELGAIGHGPAGARLADRLCGHIREWNTDRTAQPLVTAGPAGTPGEQLPPGHIINKEHTRIAVS